MAFNPLDPPIVDEGKLYVNLSQLREKGLRGSVCYETYIYSERQTKKVFIITVEREFVGEDVEIIYRVYVVIVGKKSFRLFLLGELNLDDIVVPSFIHLKKNYQSVLIEVDKNGDFEVWFNGLATFSLEGQDVRRFEEKLVNL